MTRIPRPHRRPKLAAALSAAALGLVAVLAGHSPSAEAADDIDLLRKKGGQPYVFFLIDTSGSMVLDEDDNWVIANGDDPDSKIFQIKRALYEVMSGVESVHFGLASFNQDRLQVQSKHWLYAAAAPANLEPFSYPSAAGEVWTFGRHVNATGEAGTCAAPLSLSAARQQLNRFARLGVDGEQTTTLWVSSGGKTHRVRVSPAAGSSGALGSATLVVKVDADEVKKCGDPVEVAVGGEPVDVTFSRIGDFLMVESNGVPNAADGQNCTSAETMKSVWPYTDVLAQNTCGSGSSAPFTGRGWDGNTDSGDRIGHEDLDACWIREGAPGVCVARPNPTAICDLPPEGYRCYNLRFPTVLNPDFDELDKGDHIPLNWQVDYQDEFLRRLNPRHPSYLPKALWDENLANGEASPADFAPFFGIATYFQDQRDPTTELLQLRDENQRPLVAFGNSPLGRAINDFRCWYLGDDSGKCKGPSFDPGWEAVFRDNDLEYGCRVPYLIIISDGEDNSKGENPSADTANLFSKSGVRTFAFTFNSTAQLHSIVQNGKGDLILVDDGDDLARKLREIIGFIEEESRTFASAAVPSVQAAVEDKIFLTEFTPLDQAGAWDGHVHSFLKPLPIDELSGRPDITDENHLWDAAKVMLLQSPPPAAGDTSTVDLQVGLGLDQRRVFYAGQPDPEAVPAPSWAEPANRRLFTRSTDQSTNRLLALDATAEERDLWDGLGLAYDPEVPESVQEARKEAFTIIERTLIQRTYSSPETGSLTYILGDIFHSDPLVIGGPVNTLYFIQDAEEILDDGGGSVVERGTGYREFFLTHENRRKIVVAGANDGMLHAWDAGKAEIVLIPESEDTFGIERDEVRFDNGSGRELFAYIPRSVMPTAIKSLANDAVSHQWSVDGSVAAGDVFIDPLHGGTPSADEREWRTVLIGGLREGGSAYYALDLTHPDHLTTGEIGPVAEELEAERRTVSIPSDQEVLPDCLASITGECPGPIPYPAPLWEFTDRIWDPLEGDDGEFVALDEDELSGAGGLRGKGQPDLGETWSTPDIGRIRVVEDGAVVNKYVAVFGGGLDPEKADARGNFLYIVDFETGEVLYKRQVDGAVPSDPAAVDTDQDSFFDRVYFGTTAGFMYRLDLVDPSQSEPARYPELVTQQVATVSGRMFDAIRIEDDPRWEPVAILDTGGRPIYYPPTVQFVAKANRFALGFGTGERDALGFKSDDTGRFYTFVDNSDPVNGLPATPLTESGLTRIDLASPEHGDLLASGGGWFLVLDLEERLISAPAGLIGITFFATFDPQVVNETCEVGPSCKQNPQCSLSGNSRIYLVETATANPLLATVDGVSRFMEVTGFVTEPFTEQGLSKNQDGQSEEDGPDADELTEREREMMDDFQALMPANCKFGNHRIDIKLIAADTRLERIAAVPICIIEKNWMEVAR